MNIENIDEIKLKNFCSRTDLAYDDGSRFEQTEIPDYVLSEEKCYDIPLYCSEVGPIASEKIGKQVGTYYTIDLKEIDFHDITLCEKVEKAVAQVIKTIITNRGLLNKKALLIGLGNINVTPDALGPYVMDNVIVTRHLDKMGTLCEGFGIVSAISPGVMGCTGIETFDIIKAVEENIDIDFLIVVDALASNAISRVNKTIQITDTGIRPGSGVGNKRKELSIKTLGIPVIAIGVPTVVDAITIVNDAINNILGNLSNKIGNENLSHNMFGKIGELSDEEKKKLFDEILTPNGLNMMVTPKDVDSDIEDLAKIIATGLNLALHPGLLSGYTE